jgi:hypothetical protein
MVIATRPNNPGIGLKNVHLSMTSVDLVRGALAAVHAFVKPGVMKRTCGKPTGRAESEPSFAWSRRRGIYRVPNQDSGRKQFCRYGLT